MGRNISVATAVATALTPRQAAVAGQNGTPKALSLGQTARACYAMMSYNTSSTGAGIVYFDKYFHQVVPDRRMDTNSTVSQSGNYQYMASGDAQINNAAFGGSVSSTSSQPSSSGTSNYMNATNAAGEFGNAMIDAFSNSTANPPTVRNSSWPIKYYLNQMFVDSDHSDRTMAYILNGNVYRAVSRIDGDYNYDLVGTSSYSVASVNGNMYGSASYNNVRKELVILSYNSSGGAYTLTTYQGIDFDKYPSPYDAFNASGVTRTDKSVSFASWWQVNNNESYYNIKPTLCDNGDVYVTVMFTSNSFYLLKVTRDASLNPTASVISSKSLTTSYGRDQGVYYGQKRIQSRDGGAVLCFCPYYYYGAGVYTWLIDKRKSTYVNTSQFDSGDSGCGYIPVPYGDDGFAEYYCGNAYASNYSGSYITAVVQRGGAVNSGGFIQTGTNLYLPYFPLPNTTNYPGFTQVVDFACLTNQATI